MERKKNIFIAYILSFSFMGCCMDDHVPKLSAQNPQTVIHITDGADRAGSPVREKKPSPVPNIVIASQQSSSSSRLIKKRVESVKELGGHIARTQSTQRTARQTPPITKVARTKKIDDDQVLTTTLPDDPVIPRQKRSFLPQSVEALAGKRMVQDKKMYSEKEVWKLIESCNPVLHDFGKKHNLELDDLEVFAACIEELEINPKLITEHIHANSSQLMQKGRIQQLVDRVFGDPYDNHLDRLHKKYEKMQLENPEEYKAMLLELMKAAADQADGQQTNRSTIADTHTSFQSQENADLIYQNRLTLGGLVVALFTAVPGWSTSIWQFISPSNCTG